MAAWTERPQCCGAPDIQADPRFEPKPGPTSERVAVCRSCNALWVEEWMVLWIGDGERSIEVAPVRLCGDEQK